MRHPDRGDDEIAAEPTTWAGPVRQLSWQLDESIASSQRGAPWEHATSGEALRAWLISALLTAPAALHLTLRSLNT